MIDWRKIEQALVEIAKGNGYDVFDHAKSGDNYIAHDSIDSDQNLTELAKELAERLK